MQGEVFYPLFECKNSWCAIGQSLKCQLRTGAFCSMAVGQTFKAKIEENFYILENRHEYTKNFYGNP